MFGLDAISSISAHSAETEGVFARNRAKLLNFNLDNEEYMSDVILNNSEWKNEVIDQEIDQDNIYKSMVDQWLEADQQLDELYAHHSFKQIEALTELYKNDYAGEQTGVTAQRVADDPYRKVGHALAYETAQMILAKDRTVTYKDTTVASDAASKADKAWQAIRFSPAHGHTPVAPYLESAPSRSKLMFNLAAKGLTTFGVSELFKAKPWARNKKGGGGSGGGPPGGSAGGSFLIA
tara:strand:+ start:437 stop:1144 length:708 start_codon:yes stop_codon:yes gene_type:complete